MTDQLAASLFRQIAERYRQLAHLYENLATLSDGGTPPTRAMLDPTRVKLSDLELSVRTYNALMKAGARSLADVLTYSPSGLRRVRNLGTRSFNEVHEVVVNLGFAWPTDVFRRIIDENGGT